MAGVVRGGGSKDDLSAFNLEKVCRDRRGEGPAVTAVGHQTDFTSRSGGRCARRHACRDERAPIGDVLHRLGAVGSRLGQVLQRRTRLARERFYRTEDRLERESATRCPTVDAPDHSAAKLDALSPPRQARGYAVRAADGHVLCRLTSPRAPHSAGDDG
jgi:exonuclease VII large subunit